MSENVYNQIVGHDTFTVSSTAIALPNLPTTARAVRLECESAAGIRWRGDGIDPTASEGVLLPSAMGIQEVDITGAGLDRIRMIRSGSSDATITATYFR